ncbi:T9SS type B sorting domain-containing protein [Flavobacterium sp.]|uniref:T9SS type B sorting domain-containing protein n=1 Tax=Flavobacterium sp. TaxID=239 RepID=UPI000A932E23|nr:T9SS type B sorting domain-containing protein [Flavobacterium sp.]
MKNSITISFVALFIVFGIQMGFAIPKNIDPPLNKSAAPVAPTITAFPSSNSKYCPLSQTKIVSSVTITHDPTELTTEAVFIQISSGYVLLEDQLLLINPLLHPTITSSWNALEGKLKLSSPTSGVQVNYSEFEAAIEDIVYTNSNPNPTGTRNFSITLGNGLANYLPSNGHYYEYVPSLGITWTNAKAAAALKTFYGLQGYLATITAADEAQLAGKQAPGTGWIGGTDEATEGVWKWVTGPEAGTVFWNGTATGSSPNFAFWNTNEPNQAGNEDYAHITAPGVGIPGSWNDLTNGGATSGSYQPKGYIVEYGGMPGDPSLQLSASTSLTMAGKITATNSNSNCGAGNVTLNATATFGTIEWYTTATGGTPFTTGNNITTPFLTSTTNYYVSAGCATDRTQITATINPLPVVQNTSITQCDTDATSDGKTTFNLTVNNDLISANYTNETFKYFNSVSSATNEILSDLIPNEFSYNNTTPSRMPIGVRVFNSVTGCSSPTQITLIVPTTNFQPSATFTFTVCDDFLDTDGNNTSNNNSSDGIATFNFSTTRAAILAQLPAQSQNYTINYYRNEADALSQLNAILDIANYRNIGYPNAQDIWVRIETDIVSNTCVGVGPYIRLNVEALPKANTINDLRVCDSNSTGIVNFDTSNLETNLLNGQTNVIVRYLDLNDNPLQDANGTLITSPFPSTFSSTTQTIKAIVSNNTSQRCFDETTISFYVDAIPTATPIPTTFTTICDDEADPANQDGKFGFDTSTFESTILAGQTGMTVKYYDQNNTLLPSPLPNPFVTGTQNINVIIENSINPNCSATLTIPFVVHPIPNIELSATELICSNLPTFFVTLNPGFLDNSLAANFNYNWKKDGGTSIATSPTFGVNSEGSYTVEVTNPSGCSRTRTIQVTASNQATISSIDIVDLVDFNTVTINTTGPGDYEYSMDYLNGIWQDSNIFTNVPGGIHQVFVNDKNGCGLVSKEITVLSIPKFFTPNTDGFNDYWTVKGMLSYPTAELRIFDRYGKLLKELRPTSIGWDGTFNGQPLPASDYWFVFKLDSNTPEKRGHFTLKR